MTNRYILALDGGATKTSMTIRSLDGRELFSATSTGSNYQTVGTERVQHVFDGLLRSAAAHLPQLHIDIGVFAIAGIDTAHDKKIVDRIIHESITRSSFTFGQIVTENDVEATLKGLATNHMSLLISGTGAICYSYVDGEVNRVGGWGHRIGDEGSGYWIGKHIAKAIFRAADGRNKPTALTDIILKAHHVSTTDELYNLIYSKEYTNVLLASLCSYLQPAIDLNDEVAIFIANKAAKELVLLASTTLKKAPTQHTLFLNGGVLKNNPYILNSVTKQLKELYPTLIIQVCDEKPLESIFKRGLKELEKNLQNNPSL